MPWHFGGDKRLTYFEALAYRDDLIRRAEAHRATQ